MGNWNGVVTMRVDQENSDGSISGQFMEWKLPFTGNVNGNTIDITWKLDFSDDATRELIGTVAGNKITGTIKDTSPEPPSNSLSLSFPHQPPVQIQLYKGQPSGEQ